MGQGEGMRDDSVDLDSVDLNNVVPVIPMVGLRSYSDDIVVEGPY